MQPTNDPVNQQPQDQPSGVQPQEPQQPQQTTPNTPPPRRTATLLVVIGACLIAIAAALWLVANNSDKNQNDSAVDESNNNSSSMVDLSSVRDVRFITPDDMSAYQPVDVTETFSSYLIVTGESSADTCQLNFGLVDAQKLPGNDAEAILRPQMEELSQRGAKIDGPNKVDTLILKSADGSQSYRLPTYQVSVNKDDTAYGTELYSVVILKDGMRALVSRSCSSTTGPLDPTSLQKLQATAEQIRVTAK